MVNGIEDGRRRSPRLSHLYRAPILFRGGNQRGELFTHDPETGRVGALEGIDRLLLVTHREYRAARSPGLRIHAAQSRKEVTSQLSDDPPLGRASVLGFVYQYVVDAAVQLVMHPGDTAFVGE